MKRYSLMTAVLALITALALALTLGGCPNLNDDPPIEVGGLTAAPGGESVTLSWTDPGGTYTAVEITLNPAAGGVTQPITVARGTATRRISGLANGTPYTFTVKLVYVMGSKSPGVTVMAIPVGGDPGPLDSSPGIGYSVTVDGAAYTATTTKIDFAFDDPVSELAAGDIIIGGTPGEATKGTPTGSGKTWSLPLTVTTPGAATVSINKAGIKSGEKNIILSVFNPSAPSIAAKFGIDVTANSAAKVTEVFTALKAYLATGLTETGSGITLKLGAIALGDYIDLPSLTVAGYPTDDATSGYGKFTAPDQAITLGAAPFVGYDGRLLRLIVVGINTYRNKNGNGTTPHVVFQFQNRPGTHRMNATATNVGGYKESELRKYLAPVDGAGGNFLAGLTAAGVPADVLWAPTRMVANRGSGATAADTIMDTLFLPTSWEMFGSNSVSNDTYETDANQGRFAYYEDNAHRIKYTSSHTATGYFVASPYKGSASEFGATTIPGASGSVYSATVAAGVAPAFCVK